MAQNQMFKSVVEQKPRSPRQWITQAVTAIAQVVVVLVFLVGTMLATDTLPALPTYDFGFTIHEVVLPPPPPLPPTRVKVAVEKSKPNVNPSLPTKPPDDIYPEPGPENPVGPEGPGVPGPDIFIGDKITNDLPEPPPPPKRPEVVRPDGGKIKAPQQITRINPTYPVIAQSARVQGVVIIEAWIDTDGTVKDAKVLRSVPLLDQAALEAVRQWRYTPTLLNGVPVQVLMTVTVNFSLKD